MTPEPVLGS